jgi:hypothetical protein
MSSKTSATSRVLSTNRIVDEYVDEVLHLVKDLDEAEGLECWRESADSELCDVVHEIADHYFGVLVSPTPRHIYRLGLTWPDSVLVALMAAREDAQWRAMRAELDAAEVVHAAQVARIRKYADALRYCEAQ